MSTEQRRLEALQELVRITRVGGLVLVYVWALEQDEDEAEKEENALKAGINNNKDYEKTMTCVDGNVSNFIEEGMDKLNLVNDKDTVKELDNQNAIEKSNLVGGKKSQGTIEHSKEKLDLVNNAKNDEACEQKYIQVAAGRNTFQQQDLLVPWHLKNSSSESSNTSRNEENKTQEQVFHRFYHVFKRGELRQLCCRISNVSVKDLYLDRGNWCIVLQKNEI